MLGVAQKMIPDSLATALRMVKILAIYVGHSLDAAIGFLICFPCIDRLYIEVSYIIWYRNSISTC